jgi:hypothetical protein
LLPVCFATATGCLHFHPSRWQVKLMPCGRCLQAQYCSRPCQVADWHAGHKKVCAPQRRCAVAARVAQAGREEAVVKPAGDGSGGEGLGAQPRAVDAIRAKLEAKRAEILANVEEAEALSQELGRLVDAQGRNKARVRELGPVQPE